MKQKVCKHVLFILTASTPKGVIFQRRRMNSCLSIEWAPVWHGDTHLPTFRTVTQTHNPRYVEPYKAANFCLADWPTVPGDFGGRDVAVSILSPRID